MIVYDIEVKNPPVVVKGREHYKYANGWEDYNGMGISVVGLYDYEMDTYESFSDDKHDLERLQYLLLTTDVVVGFNIIKFDNKMLHAYGITIKDSKCYDILRHLWSAHGLDPDKYNALTHRGFSLDYVLKANFDNGVEKSMHGIEAPFKWQDGKHQEVIDYCINDVRVERALLDKIFETGGLISPIYKTHIRMPLP